MQIITTSVKNTGVNVVKGRGNMTGRDSEDLKAYLFDRLDKSKNTHLIDFAQIEKIDCYLYFIFKLRIAFTVFKFTRWKAGYYVDRERLCL